MLLYCSIPLSCSFVERASSPTSFLIPIDANQIDLMLLPSVQLTGASPVPAVCARLAARRHVSVQCWTGETSASIVIRAPPELLCEAYADIERMPQWSPLLESVTLVDPLARRSEWALRVPRPLRRLVRAAGMGNLVCWEAVHEVDAPHVLRWQSLSGIQNSGVATFQKTSGRSGCSTVTLCMSYTLPDVAGALIDNSLAQSFVQKTMLSTMERFKTTLEREAEEVLLPSAR